jgi:hypothetical protein
MQVPNAGAMPAALAAQPWTWQPGMHSLLLQPFAGAERMQRNHSQAWQDLFVLTALGGKRGGSYLEVGAHVPVDNNNTCLLHREFDWEGVSIELDPVHFPAWLRERPQSSLLLADALRLDYAGLLEQGFANAARRLDYLQLDIDPSIHTLQVLERLPLDSWRFSVITFETDAYRNDLRARERSREILTAHGYALVAADVSVLYPPVSPDPIAFEDWWLDPQSIDAERIRGMQSMHRPGDTPHRLLFGSFSGAAAR